MSKIAVCRSVCRGRGPSAQTTGLHRVQVARLHDPDEQLALPEEAALFAATEESTFQAVLLLVLGRRDHVLTHELVTEDVAVPHLKPQAGSVKRVERSLQSHLKPQASSVKRMERSLLSHLKPQASSVKRMERSLLSHLKPQASSVKRVERSLQSI